MKVYVLMQEFDYEGRQLVGVFKNLDTAKQKAIQLALAEAGPGAVQPKFALNKVGDWIVEVPGDGSRFVIQLEPVV